jgi:aminopeptidase
MWYCTDTMTPDTKVLIEKATTHIRDTLSIAIEHDASHRALIVYDTDQEFSRILTDAYRQALPEGTFVDFNRHTREEIIALFDTLSPRDLVVLIQSNDFRLNEFRIRIQLFQRKLKVIDHRHLYRHTPDTWSTYVDALAYDPAWYRGVGPRLKQKLETVDVLRVVHDTQTLVVRGGLEIPKPNLGDYTGMENIGGTFPIGEVFTEAKDLSAVNGSLMIYAFADTDFQIKMYEPFRIDIENGLVTGWSSNTPESFVKVVAAIQTNERAIIREVGFGLNRAITAQTPLNDITAFERTLGLHFSLGEKHTVYKKAGITADKTRYHVDLFPVVSEVYADDTLIFKDGVYSV